MYKAAFRFVGNICACGDISIHAEYSFNNSTSLSILYFSVVAIVAKGVITSLTTTFNVPISYPFDYHRRIFGRS